MLERMREFSKGWTMKILLGLVALSFVAYFGAAPGSGRRQERQITAVWVNGESVTTQEYWRIFNNLREEQQRAQGFGLDEQQQNVIARRALDEAINHKLSEQWFRQMGLKITDQEVSEYVRGLWQQVAPGHSLTADAYGRLIQSFGLRSAQQFEDAIRRQLALEKVSYFFASMAKLPEPELEREFLERQEQVKVKVVSFDPTDYLGEVELDQQQLTKYYEDNREFYRQPERVQVEYVRVRPADVADQVVIVEDLLKDFYRQNMDRYQTDPKASADFLRFAPEDYLDAVSPTEEEIRQYYEENLGEFKTTEKVQVRYIPIAIQDPEGENAPSERRLQVTYADQKHLFQEIEVSMIRLLLPPGASSGEQSQMLSRIQSIRKEILDGKDFADAARAYSDDPSAEQGGRLGFKMRGQLPRTHENVVFRLGEGDISDPVQDDEGYVIFKVHSIHEPPIEEIRTEVTRHYAKERLDQVLRELGGQPIPEQSVWKGFRVYETDFFSMGEPVDERVGTDYHVFGRVAFRLRDGQTSQPVYGLNHMFLMTRLATQEARQMTLAEARQAVIQKLKEKKAPEVARQKAEEAQRLLEGPEGLTFEEVAARLDRDIANTGFFGPGDTLPTISANPYPFMLAAFQLEPDEISDLVEMDTGFFLLRGQPMLQASIPVFQEIRPQVEADFRKVQSIHLARDRAYEYLVRLQEQEMGLRVLATLEEGLTVRDSGVFSIDDTVPGVVDPNQQFRRTAFSIGRVGDVWPDVVELSRATAGGQQQEVDAFYLLQLKDRVPTHVPPLSAVADRVSGDLKRVLAADLARAEAEEFVGQMKSKLADLESGVEADLEEWASGWEYEVAETPFFSRMGYIPGIPGAADSPVFSRTAFGLKPGQISGLVHLEEKEEVETPTGEKLTRRLPGAFYVMQLVEKREADVERYADRRQSLSDQMIYHRRVVGYQGWLKERRQQAEIVRNENVLREYGLSSLLEDQEGAKTDSKKEETSS